MYLRTFINKDPDFETAFILNRWLLMSSAMFSLMNFAKIGGGLLLPGLGVLLCALNNIIYLFHLIIYGFEINGPNMENSNTQKKCYT